MHLIDWCVYNVLDSPNQRVGGSFPFTDEYMTLQHLDARRPPQDRREQRRVVYVGVPGEGGVQGQEPLHLLPRGAGHLHVPHRGAVVQRVYREESGNLLSVFINILKQEPVGPHGQPGVDPLGPQGTFFRVKFLERLLDTLEPVLGYMWDGGAEVEDPAPADGRGPLLLVPGHVPDRAEFRCSTPGWAGSSLGAGSQMGPHSSQTCTDTCQTTPPAPATPSTTSSPAT